MSNLSFNRVSVTLFLIFFVVWGCDPEAGEQTVISNDIWEFSALGDSATVSWEIEFNEQIISDRQFIEQQLPPMIRGSADPLDTPPLVLDFRFDQPMVLGFHVDKVSPVTSNQAFDVRVNGELYHRKVTPWTDGDNVVVDSLYYIHLPSGETTVIFKVFGAYRASDVYIDRYYLSESPDNLPGNVIKLPENGHPTRENTQLDGYHGVWYELGQPGEYGDKYSGGLGTYTANHLPLAMYVEELDKTFFVYGGSVPGQTLDRERELLDFQLVAMIGSFDHATGKVSRPTVVYELPGVNDPHFNPTLSIGPDGHLFVFLAGRAFGRPGHIFRSTNPYSIEEFEHVRTLTMNYPQPWLMPDNSWFLSLTKYTDGRTIYWQTSQDPDGKNWNDTKQLLRMGGHYAISRPHGNMIGKTANYHIGGSPDRRTNLYYLQTTDRGETWTTVDGEILSPPLTDPVNPARVIDYESQGLFVYLMDMAYDVNGYPVILYVTTQGFEAGPPNDPRIWQLTRWDGSSWQTFEVTRSDHNYDVGSLNIENDEWRIIGPGRSGPQPYQTGGEIDLWISTDKGETWSHKRKLTANSKYNHNYVRRPVSASDPFYAFWADGNPLEYSESRLYFSDRTGRNVWRLPAKMTDEWMEPERILPVDD